MKIAFRVDASREIGTGHLIRCLTLAQALRDRDVQIRFVCRHLPANFALRVQEAGHELIELAEPVAPGRVSDLPHSHWLGTSQRKDAAETLEALADYSWDWMIVDHYAIDIRWESELRAAAKKIMVIDDIADRNHDCDLLLDPGFFDDPALRYAKRLPNKAVRLLGPQYAMLPEEYASLAKSRVGVREHVEQVEIYFGSAGTADMIENSIHAAKLLGNTVKAIDVILPKTMFDRTSMHTLASSDVRVNFHHSLPSLAPLHCSSDFAIGSGGSTVWERLCLGVPSLLAVTAANQAAPLHSLATAGAIGLPAENVWKSVASLTRELRNASALHSRESMAKRGRELVGGRGTTYACSSLLTSIRPFHDRDVDSTFSMVSKESVWRPFLMSAAPSSPELNREYWARVRADSAQAAYAIEYSHKHVGNCGIKRVDEKIAEGWIYLDDAVPKGEKIGYFAFLQLMQAAEEKGYSQISVSVAASNYGAIKLYRNAGFKTVPVGPLASSFARMDQPLIFMQKNIGR